MAQVDDRTLPSQPTEQVKASARDAQLREARLPEQGGEPVPPLRADHHTTNDPAVENPVEARQGFLGRPVLMVLAAGLGLALVAWMFVALVA